MTKIWRSEIDLSLITLRNKNSMGDFLGIEFTEIGDDFIKGTMPVDERTKQPIGIMHGGASCVLAETLGSVAGNYAVDNREYYCVGLDINTNHIRAIREGKVIGIAKPFHLGKSTQVWSIEIKNEQDELISVSRLTLAVLNRR